MAIPSVLWFSYTNINSFAALKFHPKPNSTFIDFFIIILRFIPKNYHRKYVKKKHRTANKILLLNIKYHRRIDISVGRTTNTCIKSKFYWLSLDLLSLFNDEQTDFEKREDTEKNVCGVIETLLRQWIEGQTAAPTYEITLLCGFHKLNKAYLISPSPPTGFIEWFTK